MNQKYVRYFLIAGVTVVWGLIIYRVVEGLSGDDDLLPVTMNTAKLPVLAEKEEPYRLIADYPDPFLAGGDDDTASAVVLTTAVSAPSSSTIYPPVAPPPPPPDPDAYKEGMFQYVGMISNPEKKIKIATVVIKGTELVVKEKDKVMGFVIGKIEAGKIVVSYRGKRMVIGRS